ncbi:helix-turn-helix transcriptional regulator [uncultured Victivallis sp.]|uniref:helix-turn-helix domain-containing protein n=1 Tax=uncultured Victivallis sp. TaxID=354118 RepID=UPI0025928D46|nr:helix-turn-helix transcriptional regulator [uncultured Victivallis sp.]
MGNKETPQRQEFGNALKVILKRNNIKIREVANALGVTPGYMSQIINGQTLLTEERFTELYSYLEDNIASNDDVLRLSAMYCNAKAGTSFLQNNELIQATTIQKHFLQLFIQLTSDQQMQILQTMLQFIENNHQAQAIAAGIEPPE